MKSSISPRSIYAHSISMVSSSVSVDIGRDLSYNRFDSVATDGRRWRRIDKNLAFCSVPNPALGSLVFGQEGSGWISSNQVTGSRESEPVARL